MNTNRCLPRHCKLLEILTQRATVLWGKKREEYEIHEDDIKERKLEVLEDLSDGLPPSRDKKILIHASTEISPVILCTVLARHT